MVSGAYVSPADTNPGSLFQHKMNHQVFRAPPKVFQTRALTKVCRALPKVFQTRALTKVCRALLKVFQIRALPKMTVTSMTRMDGRLLTEAAVEVLAFVDFCSVGGAPVAAAVGSLAAERMLVNGSARSRLCAPGRREAPRAGR